MIVRKVLCKTAASPSGLPGLNWALNPYRGCGHACSYCYAQDVTRFEMGRPWGEVVEVKVNFVATLKKQLAKKPKGTFGLGTVTDPYQALEAEFRLSRGCLKELRTAGLPVSVLTKSDLVLRDIDLITGWDGAEVGVSIGIVDDDFASAIEPGAPRPSRRFDALRRLTESGVDTYVMAAPIIPGVCDSEGSLRTLVEKTAENGVKRIMWDKFNPKRIASPRLKRALSSLSVELTEADDAWIASVRSTLLDECRRNGVDLSDAF